MAQRGQKRAADDDGEAAFLADLDGLFEPDEPTALVEAKKQKGRPLGSVSGRPRPTHFARRVDAKAGKRGSWSCPTAPADWEQQDAPCSHEIHKVYNGGAPTFWAFDEGPKSRHAIDALPLRGADEPGIAHVYLRPIELRIEAGQKASKIHGDLIVEAGQDAARKAALPDLAQVQSYVKDYKLRHAPRWKLENVADLQLYYGTSKVHDKAGFDALVASKGTDAFVLIDMITLTDGEGGVYEACLFSSSTMLNIGKKAAAVYGEDNILCVTDGKHKTEAAGWIIIPFGTSTRYFDRDKGKYSNKFLPIAYIFTKSETKDVFTFAHAGTVKALSVFMGVKVTFSALCADASPAIRSGFWA
ncbi:hypothetical protein JL722_5247 [Aureococcus anophagefferens]|nr:hypothetical protein JL722_5247 [Aureococcus anophagefferens]